MSYFLEILDIARAWQLLSTFLTSGSNHHKTRKVQFGTIHLNKASSFPPPLIFFFCASTNFGTSLKLLFRVKQTFDVFSKFYVSFISISIWICVVRIIFSKPNRIVFVYSMGLCILKLFYFIQNLKSIQAKKPKG